MPVYTMELINLKTPITFRLNLSANQTVSDIPQIVAFTTKAFRGRRGGTGEVPRSTDHVCFDVFEIAIEAANPWYKLSKPQRITVIWSNVLSVQYEDAII